MKLYQSLIENETLTKEELLNYLPLHRMLVQCGIKCYKLQPIFLSERRRHYKVFSSNKTYILVDSSHELDNLELHLQIHQLLIKYRINVPSIIEYCLQSGYLLMEDCTGMQLQGIIFKSKGQEEIFYETLVAELIKLTEIELDSVKLPLYSAQFFHKEYHQVIDLHAKNNITDNAINELESIFDTLYQTILKLPQTIVLQEFTSRNIFMQQLTIEGKVWMVNFQDTIIGCTIYDLVTLLEDKDREINRKTIEKCKDIYRTILNIDAQLFEDCYHIFMLLNEFKKQPDFKNFKTLSQRVITKPLQEWINSYIITDIATSLG